MQPMSQILKEVSSKPFKDPKLDWITQEVVDEFKKVEGLYRSDARYDFGWWYQYFWKEARVEKGCAPDQIKRLIAMIYEFKIENNLADGHEPGHGIEFKPGRSWPIDVQRQRIILAHLLLMGFREMPVKNINTLDPPDAQKYFSKLVEVYDNKEKINIPIGYRGVGTSFADLLKYKGALNRATLGLFNMDKPWHPFCIPHFRSKLYFRANSGDNCLFTVISAAVSPELAVGFPLIEDQEIYKFPRKPLEQWTEMDVAQCKSGDLPLCLARVACTVNGLQKVGVFLATQTYIYAFKVAGDTVHTQSFLEDEMGGEQNQCPERGVRSVPLGDFLFGVRVYRIHLGPTRYDGVIAFVRERKFMKNGSWDDNIPDTFAFADEHFYGDRYRGRIFLWEFVMDKFAANARIKGESANPKKELPKNLSVERKDASQVKKLQLPGAFANTPLASYKKPMTGLKGQQGNVSATAMPKEVRAAVQDNVDVTLITHWDIPFSMLRELRESAQNLYLGRTT
jgi:hypothetical protein